MRLSIFTTITDPDTRGDHWQESFKCYADLADELVVVDGSQSFGGNYSGIDQVVVNHEWPREFDWTLIGQQFQRGYEAATGDWVIHADLDFIFHENDFKKLREALDRCDDYPALSFWKYQFILPDRYNIKSRLVLAVNKRKFGNRIKFDGGGGADLCQPSLDGKLIEIDQVPEARIPFYNYEKICKNTFQIADDCGRMDRAYMRTFNRYQLSEDGSDEAAFDGYIRMLKGRIKKAGKHISIDKHPIYMQEIIKNLKKSQLGYNGFDLLGADSDYLSGVLHV